MILPWKSYFILLNFILFAFLLLCDRRLLCACVCVSGYFFFCCCCCCLFVFAKNGKKEENEKKRKKGIFGQPLLHTKYIVKNGLKTCRRRKRASAP